MLFCTFFSNNFKVAIIKFKPDKEKSSTNPINYRSISLLEVPGKIFERTIQLRPNTFLTEKKLSKMKDNTISRPTKKYIQQ